MNRLFPGSVEREIAPWLSERAQRQIWWTLVAFAILDWTHPQLALTQEWWCVPLILWIVPWQRSTRVVSSLAGVITWISSLILFAWLVSHAEKAVQESVRGLFRVQRYDGADAVQGVTGALIDGPLSVYLAQGSR